MMENKKIALLGDRSICLRFFKLFNDYIQIEYFLYLQERKNDLNEEQGVKELRFDSNVVVEKDLFIILCIDLKDRKYYDDLLYSSGKVYGQDYIDSFYMLQYLKKKYAVIMKNKKNWIFGAGKNGRKFYNKYKSDLNIVGFVSNFEEETEFQNLPVIRPSELKTRDDIYIIICSESMDIMTSRLKELGLEPFKQFCYQDFMPKDVFIAVGTCQICDTVSVLERNEKFTIKYDICSFFDSPYSPCSFSDKIRINMYGSFCDVVFYGKSLQNMRTQINYEYLAERYYQNAIKIFIPFYYFDGQLMQATETINPYSVILRSHNCTFWYRGDRVINELIEQGWETEDIIREISSSNFWTEEEVLKNFNKELKRVDILDRLSSIPIKQFIIDNYRKIPIFKDGVHFCLELCIYLANQIAKKVGIEEISNIEDVISEIDGSEKTYMAIYPCVVKALRLDFGLNDCKYAFANIEERKVEYLDFKAYEKRYIEYIKMVREMKIKLGTYWS